MTLKWRSKRKSGQGLVEFALVLPLLLVLLLGMAEFARIFAIYSNLFNAAREGVRYGIVYPTDTAGILNAAQQRVSLVNVADVTFTPGYDHGPGTSLFHDSSLLSDGDRIVVNAYYDVEPMLPLLRPLLQSLYVDTTSARTIARLGGLPPAEPAPAAGTADAVVIKSATPSSVLETGGIVTFRIEVHNTGEEPLTLSSLIDDLYGDLLGPNFDCPAAGEIAPGGVYVCEFDDELSSDNLVDHVNTVEAELVDVYGRTVNPSASATVRFTDDPGYGNILVSKTADKGAIADTGEDVTFTFTVSNVSATETMTLTSLVDTYLGNLSALGCTTGQSIAPGGTDSCSIVAEVSGIGQGLHTNRVIAEAVDNEGNHDYAEDSLTITLIPSAQPIVIDPMMDGDPSVTGSAEPGEIVTLRDLSDPSLSLSAEVGADGQFSFSVSGGLVGGHVMVVEGYGHMISATVQMAPPTPTPTPGPMDISLDLECAPVGDSELVVYGYDWPNTDVRIDHIYGGEPTTLATVEYFKHETLFTIGTLDIVSATAGIHTIQAYSGDIKKDIWVPQDSETFIVPCPPEPGATNLAVQSVVVTQTQPIPASQPITFTLAIANLGGTDSTRVFWTDLYVDPDGPILPSDPSLPRGDTYAAVGAVAAGAFTTVVLDLPAGIGITGVHTAVVMADTWHEVVESDELDNVFGPVTVPITVGSPPMGFFPTPTPFPTGRGSVSGSTWLYYGGSLVPQGRVLVSLYSGGNPIAQTFSDRSGQYLLEDVPAGVFTMFGELYIDDELYLDILTNVEVKNGQLTPYRNLVLH